jgi:hypothetical protein
MSKLKKLKRPSIIRPLAYPLHVQDLRQRLEVLGFTASEQCLDWALNRYHFLWGEVPYLQDIDDRVVREIIGFLEEVNEPEEFEFPDDRKITIDP